MPAHCWVELGLVPLVGRAMSRGAFRGGSGLRKILGSLSANGWCCVPALLVVWSETLQHWCLHAVGWGQVLVSKGRSPGELKPVSTLWYLHHQCSCPCSEAHFPCIPRRPLKLADMSGPGSYELTAFFLVPGVEENLCATSKSGVSGSPSRVEFLRSSPGQMLWGSSS